MILSRRIGPRAGLDRLHFKLESLNPTGAFKARPAALAIALAQEARAGGILTASSGNAGSALAAYAAAVGLPCVVLLEPGNPPNKTRQMLAYDARVLPVAGLFHQSPEELAKLLAAIAAELDYYLAFIWAPVNPYLLEGIKSISYEVCAAMDGPPDRLLAPVGGGDMFAAQWRGYEELVAGGIADRLPRMVAVQSTAAAPLLKAQREGLASVPRLPDAGSTVSGINVAFSGDHALLAVRQSNGSVEGVTDDDVYAMQARLAREEGLWVEPAGAAPVAAAVKMAAAGHLEAGERLVCVLSGAGFKDAELGADEAETLLHRQGAPFEVSAVLEEIESGG